MCFLDIVTFWYDGVKMVDFGVCPQGWGNQVTALLGLAREGNLLIWRLGWVTGLPHWLHRLAWVPLCCYIVILGRFMGDLGYQNIEILVALASLNHG